MKKLIFTRYAALNMTKVSKVNNEAILIKSLHSLDFYFTINEVFHEGFLQ